MATAVDPRGNREWAPYVIGLALGLGVLGAPLAAVPHAQIVLEPQERIEQRPIDTLT